MIRIPRIIHQTWRDENLPPIFKRFSQTWKEMLPDWEYKLWTDNMNEEFVQEYYPSFYEKFRAYPKAIQRADAIRYLLLNTYGGLYVDMDFECLNPNVATLLENADFIAGKEPYMHAQRYGKDYIVCNAFMASVPNNKFLVEICRQMMNHPNGWNVQNGLDVLNSTGPFLLTDVYKRYEQKNGIRILEPEYLYPIVLGEASSVIGKKPEKELAQRLNRAYAIHYFVGTWSGRSEKRE